MKHAVSRELHAYWTETCRGRTSPERSDIDPAAIRHVLAYTFILELAGNGAAQAVTIRLSGTRLNALFRSELKGRDFLGLWSGSHAAGARALIDTALDDRLAVVAGVRGATAGGETIDAELLLLPLRHHGRTHVRLLGSLAATVVPSWIGLRAVSALDLGSWRSVATPAGPRPPSWDCSDADRPGAVDRLATRAGEVSDDGRRIGTLTVYQGGRRDADLRPTGP